MTDRQLLEHAAKAAGLNIKAYRVDIDDNFTHLIVGRKNTKEKIDWNPLTDDGDALRLAVKLKIELVIFSDTVVPSKGVAWKEGNKQCSFWEPEGSDPYAATRRAITRAAAEIGKGME